MARPADDTLGQAVAACLVCPLLWPVRANLRHDALKQGRVCIVIRARRPPDTVDIFAQIGAGVSDDAAVRAEPHYLGAIIQHRSDIRMPASRWRSRCSRLGCSQLPAGFALLYLLEFGIV